MTEAYRKHAAVIGGGVVGSNAAQMMGRMEFFDAATDVDPDRRRPPCMTNLSNVVPRCPKALVCP